MNLTDRDILELNELCNALIEGSLSETQKGRLSHLLSSSSEARKFYLRAMGVSASLMHYAAEMQTEAPDAVSKESKIVHLRGWMIGVLAAAASVALLLWVNRPAPNVAPVESRAGEFVAQLTGLKGCSWVNPSAAVQPGDRLFGGQRVELASGFAEITFDCGAQVVLEGPAVFDLKSAWEATLSRGVLKATVPRQAIGFSISNPSVEVVDLGTEFTMSADANGSAEVMVLKGQVEAQPNAAKDRQPIVLREKESRRFANSGVSDPDDSGQKFARLTQPISLVHYSPPTDCVHWSFDESSGDLFKADASGSPVETWNATIKKASESTLASAHSSGRRQGDLRFDGHFYVKAGFPGIAKYAPHTVVFWVKVPKDANLGNAYAMVAWGVNSKNLGSHPIHVGWNRNPNEAALGVLRTDYGGGYAIGATPLRDGKWHHIAVVILPRDDPSNPLKVNQYVDGRLEGEGKPSPPGSDIFSHSSENASNDAVWLGCRLGVNGVRSERFLGEMDELFIADRALEPQEIVRLMYNNQLQVELTSTRESSGASADE